LVTAGRSEGSSRFIKMKKVKKIYGLFVMKSLKGNGSNFIDYALFNR
jgi:hypothetical protein